MALNKPYYRIIRPFGTECAPGDYCLFKSKSFLTDLRYAADRLELCRAYQLIEKDLLRLFEYIDPCEDNLNTYSHRTYELLLRTATEFETNCKRILEANGYNCHKNLGMKDYYKIHHALKLGFYKINLKVWHPTEKTFQPFREWSEGSHSLAWYQAYNAVKHDRYKNFKMASLDNVLTAISSLYAILFSQFFIFIDSDSGFTETEEEIIKQYAIFGVMPFRGWKPEECYDFDWEKIENDDEPFEKFSFS